MALQIFKDYQLKHNKPIVCVKGAETIELVESKCGNYTQVKTDKDVGQLEWWLDWRLPAMTEKDGTVKVNLMQMTQTGNMIGSWYVPTGNQMSVIVNARDILA